MDNNDRLYEVIVGEDKVKIICRLINGLFQDIKSNCIYGLSVISFKEINK